MDLFQGNMDAIMEYLHAQKDNDVATTIVATNAIVVTATTTDTATAIVIAKTTIEIVIQPVVNQPSSQLGPSRHVTAQGYPLNYTPQIVGSAFVPYQPFEVPLAKGNSDSFPWCMPTHLSPQVVGVDNHEIPQGKTCQNYVSVNTKTIDDNDLSIEVLTFTFRFLHNPLNPLFIILIKLF